MKDLSKINIFVSGAMLLGTAAHAAPEFNVNVKSAEGGRSEVALSYLAEGNVTALDFAVELGVSGRFHADLRQCLVSLPKTHTGVCRVQGDTLRGVIYSRDNATLGDTNIGSVIVEPGSMLKAGVEADEMAVRGVNVTAVSPSGSTVSTSVRVNGQIAPNQ